MPTELAAALTQLLGAALEPFTQAESRTWWPFLLAFALTALGLELRGGRRGRGAGRVVADALGLSLWRTASARLDLQLLFSRQLLRLLGLIPGTAATFGLAVGVVRLLDLGFGRPALAAPPPWLLAGVYGLVAFVAWDLSRYLLHRLLHQSALLWQVHQVHHSAEVLTPLSFHRSHPVEVVLYELRGIVVTGALGGAFYWLYAGAAVLPTIVGVDALGFLLSAATGNLRHSHHYLRFPVAVERWLLSPAQHQVHHGARADEHGRNLGVWLACWDRWAGTWRASPVDAPATLGLPAGDLNHSQDLVTALLGPLRGLGAGLPRRWVAALLLLLPGMAAAGEEDEEEGPTSTGEIVVDGSKAGPTLVGAAHEVGAEVLERFEQDDIQRVMVTIPGVYVRGEDGQGLRPNIGMRGANSDRSAKIVLLEDGLPLAPAPYAAPAAYTFPLATRLVGVEVYKGPSAIAYGPQTIGGTVNLLTRAVPERRQGELDAAYGAYNTVKLHGWGGVGERDRGLLLEGAHLSSDGFKVLDGGGETGFSRQDLMAKGRLVLRGESARHELGAKIGFGREASDETYLGLSLADFADDPYRRYAASARDHMSWMGTRESLTWQVQKGGRFTLQTAVYHAWLDRSWTKLNGFASGVDLHDLLLSPDGGQAATYAAILRGEEDSATADQVLLLGTNHRAFHQAGVQSVARLWSGGEGFENVAELGLRLHGDRVWRVHTEDPYQMLASELVATGGTTETVLDSATSADALAAYARDDLGVGPFHLVPGLRFEGIRTAAGTTNGGPVDPVLHTMLLPGLGVSVDPRADAEVFAGVHRGFSPLSPGADIDAVPETAWNAEVGTRWAPSAWRLQVVGFGSHYQNLQGQCTLSAGCTEALSDEQYAGGQVRVGGVEAGVGHQVPLGPDGSLQTDLSWTSTWSAFLSGFTSEFPQWGTVVAGDSLPYVPTHQGSLQLGWTRPRTELGAGATWRGEMRDVAGQGEIPDEERIPAALVVDLSGELVLTPRVRAYLLARNVADAAVVESLRPFGARPGAPRTVMLGIKVGGAPG